MHFNTKSYLKSNRNHTAKQTLHVLACPYMLNIPHSCCCMPIHAAPLNQKLQQVFIYKDLQGTPPIPTFKEVVGNYLTHVHPWT